MYSRGKWKSEGMYSLARYKGNVTKDLCHVPAHTASASQASVVAVRNLSFRFFIFLYCICWIALVLTCSCVSCVCAVHCWVGIIFSFEKPVVSCLLPCFHHFFHMQTIMAFQSRHCMTFGAQLGGRCPVPLEFKWPTDSLCCACHPVSCKIKKKKEKKRKEDGIVWAIERPLSSLMWKYWTGIAWIQAYSHLYWTWIQTSIYPTHIAHILHLEYNVTFLNINRNISWYINSLGKAKTRFRIRKKWVAA